MYYILTFTSFENTSFVMKLKNTTLLCDLKSLFSLSLSCIQPAKGSHRILVLVSYDLTKTDKDEEEMFIHIENRLNILSERQYQIFKMKVTADIIIIK